uniref:Uncharacterized protein n=1 Tax=Zea mays TaxID=4577 RepID=C0HJ59_MAIZE|nr:unknown [Zea mays]
MKRVALAPRRRPPGAAGGSGPFGWFRARLARRLRPRTSRHRRGRSGARGRSSCRGLRLSASACRVLCRWPSWPAVALLLGVAETAHGRALELEAAARASTKQPSTGAASRQ